MRQCQKPMKSMRFSSILYLFHNRKVGFMKRIADFTYNPTSLALDESCLASAASNPSGESNFRQPETEVWGLRR
jgi:hypothetical protein